MMSEVVRLFEERRQMERTEKQRLEKLVSERTRELERGREQFRLVVEGTQAIPFALDVEDGHFEYIGPQGPQRLGFSEDLWKQIGFLDRLMPRDRNGVVRNRIDESKSGQFEIETTVLTQDEKRVDLRWVASCEQSDNTGQHKVLRGMMLDVTDQRRLENELAQAQKLESVGRLAAGVAHEINTPVQFVSDSVSFVREAMDDLSAIVDKYRELRSATEQGADVVAAAKAAEEAEDDADLDYILENAPVALDRARDGLGRVAAIVRSMKEFAHPDRKEMAQADLNQAIQSTLVIASNEYKYVADVETRFGELPMVNCYAGEINQVVLNLIVNAAHAIGDVVKGTQDQGQDLAYRRACSRAKSRSPLRTPARVFRRKCARGSSIRSSPPRKSAREPGRAWPLRAAWWSTSTAARCTSRLKWAGARRSTSAACQRSGGRFRGGLRKSPHETRQSIHQPHPGRHRHDLRGDLSSLLFGYCHRGDRRRGWRHQPQLHRAARLGKTSANALLGFTVCSRAGRHHHRGADRAADRRVVRPQAADDPRGRPVPGVGGGLRLSRRWASRRSAACGAGCDLALQSSIA